VNTALTSHIWGGFQGGTLREGGSLIPTTLVHNDPLENYQQTLGGVLTPPIRALFPTLWNRPKVWNFDSPALVRSLRWNSWLSSEWPQGKEEKRYYYK
jgi:hypothetical protein